MPASETLSLSGLAAWSWRKGRELLALSFEKPLKACKVLIQADAKENFAGSHTPEGQPWPPLAHPRPSGGAVPLRDQGLLMASVVGQGSGHVEEITSYQLRLGTNLDRAAIHQHGGVIRPRNAKMLAIPLTREAARAGSPRSFPRPLGMVSRPGHPPLLVEEKAGTGKGQPGRGGSRSVFQYVLVASVTIPARRFLGFSAKVVDRIQKVFAEFLGEKL